MVSPSPTQPALCRQVNLPQTPPSRCSWLRTRGAPPTPQPHPWIPTPCATRVGTSGPCTHPPIALDPLPCVSSLLQTTHSNPTCPIKASSQHTSGVKWPWRPLCCLFLQNPTEVRATSRWSPLLVKAAEHRDRGFCPLASSTAGSTVGAKHLTQRTLNTP